ncbi:helix-turn-helix domain-containing protein [Streptomyces sp. NRRL F-2580]|uniref:helix-turn-helix domain-containing protein n=1 Tax=Streptomyces sp. NRRL F-2580 TaxID=1463841 RepID=UPI0004CBBDF4|nr:helix-turn-helix transcriptional regulator [Streptomyces sp. NRRL F-2580]
MKTSPSSAVEEARAALGRRLRDMRRPTGLSARALAARAGWHESKASRIENGKTMPSDADLLAYVTLCGEPGALEDLRATARGIDQMYVEWKTVQKAGLTAGQEAHVPLYARTHRFRIYEASVIPGLLQTEGYATTMMSRIVAFRQIPDDVESAVRVRIRRQRYMRDGHRHFSFVLEEAALRARFGGPEVMAAQLGHLLQVAAMPNVSLGVVPMTAERDMWPVEGFWIFDDLQVITELATAQITVKQPSEIDIYARMFSELAKLACVGQQARSLITDAIAALG